MNTKLYFNTKEDFVEISRLFGEEEISVEEQSKIAHFIANLFDLDLDYEDDVNKFNNLFDRYSVAENPEIQLTYDITYLLFVQLATVYYYTYNRKDVIKNGRANMERVIEIYNEDAKKGYIPNECYLAYNHYYELMCNRYKELDPNKLVKYLPEDKDMPLILAFIGETINMKCLRDCKKILGL